MVRNKSSFAKKASVFASAKKIMMLERNKTLTSTPTSKTPVTSRKSKGGTPKINQSNNSKNTTRKRRFKSGTKALREIQKFQKSTNLLIPKLPFSRLVREILQSQPRASDFRMSSMALMALQEAAEMAMVNMLEVANLCCLHAHRVTLDPRDIRLTRRAFGLGHPINY